MSVQPPSRTRFYKDKRNGKFMGVCAGIADYAGMDVTMVRILLVLACVMGGAGVLIPAYFITAWIAQDKPRQFQAADPEEDRFWQGVRQSPSVSARNLRSRLREMDRRLADVETYVTTTNRTLEREIEQLR